MTGSHEVLRVILRVDRDIHDAPARNGRPDAAEGEAAQGSLLQGGRPVVRGLLGVGEKKVAVSLPSLNIEAAEKGIVITLPTATKEALTAAPAYKRANPPKGWLQRAAEKGEEIRDKSGPAYEKAKEAAKEAYESAKEKAGPALEKAKQEAQDALAKAKEAAQPAQTPAEAPKN